MWPRQSKLSLCGRSDCSKQSPGLMGQFIDTSLPPIFQHIHWGGDLGQQRGAAQERALQEMLAAWKRFLLQFIHLNRLLLYPMDRVIWAFASAPMVLQPGKIQVEFITLHLQLESSHLGGQHCVHNH